ASWRPDQANLDFDRVITAIDVVHKLITLDAPLTNALEKKYGEHLPGSSGPVYAGWLYRYSFPGRIDHVGVENLTGVSEYDPRLADPNAVDEDGHKIPLEDQHAWTFISLVAAENAWVHDITARQFAFSAVDVQKTSKWITVQDSSNLDPISEISGGHRY